MQGLIQDIHLDYDKIFRNFCIDM